QRGKRETNLVISTPSSSSRTEPSSLSTNSKQTVDGELRQGPYNVKPLFKVTNRIHKHFEQFDLLLQGYPTVTAIFARLSLQLKNTKEERDGRFYLQVLTHELERSKKGH
ncbi:hypothetical protein A2U01_0054896, partial [Trifolium medium]|nr:hypothetical protein [Trifolium medium]